MASTSKSNKRTVKSPPVSGPKFVKASWYKKGDSGTVESAALPRTWVSRSLACVVWPPKEVNFKEAIADGVCPDRYIWKTTYQLKSCTRSVSTLDEAQQMETEVSNGESASDEEEGCLGENKGAAYKNQPPLGRGQRVKSKSSQLADYDSDGETTVADEESDAPRRQVLPTGVVEGDLGDISGSAALLQKASRQMQKSAVKTAAMKKAMPPFPIYPSETSGDVQGKRAVLQTTAQVHRSPNVSAADAQDLDVIMFAMPSPPTLLSQGSWSREFALSSTPPTGREHGPSVQSGGRSRSTSPQVTAAATQHGRSRSASPLHSDSGTRRLMQELCGESKMRHDAVIERLGRVEKKLSALTKALSRRTSGHAEGGDGDVFDVQGEAETSGDDVDLENQFCVPLPVTSFENFEKLEVELASSSDKRKVLVSIKMEI